MTITHATHYHKDEQGNDVFLLHTETPYSIIVVKIGDLYFNGLKQKLPPQTEQWCIENKL